MFSMYLELNRKGCRKIFSPLSMQTPAASFNYLENSFEWFSSFCRVSVTIFILFTVNTATNGPWKFGRINGVAV